MSSASGLVSLYDDTELSVEFHRGASEFFVLTFGDLAGALDGGGIFAEKPLLKAGISFIGIVAKKANWYPEISMTAAAEKILGTIKNYNEVILYGGSMGGYAAIKYSRLFRAARVIAFCPQWSLDKEEFGVSADPGWQDYYLPEMRGMGVRAGDVAGDVYIFIDKYCKIDFLHYELFAANCPHINLINVAGVDHSVISIFAGTANLLKIIAAVRERNCSTLLKLARDVRKGSIYRRRRIKAYIKTRTERVINWEASLHSNKIERLLLHAPENFALCISKIVARGELDHVAEFYEKYVKMLVDPNDQLAICAYAASITSMDVGLKCCHGTFVFYDINEDTCVHVDQRSVTLFPIELEISSKNVRLFASIGQTRLQLGLKEDRSIGRVRSDEGGDVFKLANIGGGGFSFSEAGKYVCAERGQGRIVVDRAEADAWETFRFGLYNRSGLSGNRIRRSDLDKGQELTKFASSGQSGTLDIGGMRLDRDRNSDLLVISCSGVVPLGKVCYAMENSSRRIETNKLFICDKSSLWYSKGIDGITGSFEGVLEVVGRIVDCLGVTRVCAVGTSGGGYMALALASRLGFERALAFSPQTVLSREGRAEIGDSRWAANMDVINSAPTLLDLKPALHANHASDFHIIFPSDDPLDRAHANRLMKSDNLHLYELVSREHNVSAELRRLNLLDAVLESFIHDDRATLRAKLAATINGVLEVETQSQL